MPTLRSTAGASNANSFVSLTEADAYFDASLGNSATWEAEDDDDQKARALIAATRDVSLMVFAGTRVTATQSLSWPREWAPNPDAPSLLVAPTQADASLAGIVYYDAAIIPQRVKDATCELAIEFLKAGANATATADSSIGVQQETVGPLTTIYFKPYDRPQGFAQYPLVLDLIGPLLDQSATGGLTMVRC